MSVDPLVDYRFLAVEITFIGKDGQVSIFTFNHIQWARGYNINVRSLIPPFFLFSFVPVVLSVLSNHFCHVYRIQKHGMHRIMMENSLSRIKFIDRLPLYCSSRELYLIYSIYRILVWIEYVRTLLFLTTANSISGGLPYVQIIIQSTDLFLCQLSSSLRDYSFEGVSF